MRRGRIVATLAFVALLVVGLSFAARGAFFLRALIALGLAAVILAAGASFVRGMAAPARRSATEEPEPVEELDVFFVCTECGTEFKVTRLGELQVPRHCGEPMAVEQRPAPAGPSLN